MLRLLLQERVAAGLAPRTASQATRRDSFNFARKSSVAPLMLAQGDKTVFDTSKLPAEECAAPRIAHCCVVFSPLLELQSLFICIFASVFCQFVTLARPDFICRYALSLGLAGPPKMKLGEGKKKNMSYAMQVI